MIKALWKKQMLEVFAFVFQDRKTQKRRNTNGIIGATVLCALLLLLMMGIFGGYAYMLCAPLVSAGFGWLYMALMSIIALSLGVFGSVFSTYTTLYKARDNDLLLAMPVPVETLLVTRLSGVYMMGLIYELLVMLPAVVIYLITAPFSWLSLVFCLLILLVLSLPVLCLSCILGWVVAAVSSRLKNQKIITVILSLAFIGGYYYLCGNMGDVVELILQNPAALGDAVKGIFYPLYQLGLAAQGDALAMLLFVAMMAAATAVVYVVLRRSFLRLATANRGNKKVKYVEKAVARRSVTGALLGKEWRRFFGSANYMLNCGFGIVFMVVGAVALLFNGVMIGELVTLIGDGGLVALIATAAVCMMTTMNDMTAPSVSLEGNTLWLLHVLPVPATQVLHAKLLLHLLLTAPPALGLTVCAEVVILPSLLFAVLMPVAVLLFVLLMAQIGLVSNLKSPDFTWTSEVVPIKQSASVAIALLGGWAIIIALGGLYYLVSAYVGATVYMLAVIVLLAAVNGLLWRWLHTKGSRIWDNL